MSVVSESKIGDELVCIVSFSASPEGEPFSWKTCRKFAIGERVRFLGSFRDEHFKDHPVGWMVCFEPLHDEVRYSATQTYFLKEDDWKRLEQYFTRRQRRKTGHQKASRK
jgi:hypothetical protein